MNSDYCAVHFSCSIDERGGESRQRSEISRFNPWKNKRRKTRGGLVWIWSAQTIEVQIITDTEASPI